MCRVTMGHLRVTIGHFRVSKGHPRVTIGHFRVTIGYHRITIGHYLFSIRKHKANTTELHPKVRQTCFPFLMEVQLRTSIDKLINRLLLNPKVKNQNQTCCLMRKV